ncbi:sensor histidine kinase [Tessaracoccus sp.]
MAFYINVFAAVRMNMLWKVPLTLGLGGLAYLTLVRNAVEGASYRWTLSIVLLVFLGLAWGGGAAVRYAAHSLQSEKETSQQRLQNLQISLARELHDSVAQTLSSAAMRANIALTDPGMAPLTREQLERIAEDCRSSAHDLRQLLSSLREAPERTVNPAPLADVESLRHAVQVQADRLHGEGFTVNTDIRITRLSAARCQTLAAITVEATNNVLKHAKPGSTCSLSMVASEDDVVAEFTNVAKNAKKSKQGFGLTGIQERLTLLDGTCSVFRRDDQWTLQARLPLGVGGNAGTTHATSALRMAR